jgi:hypothetical protein
MISNNKEIHLFAFIFKLYMLSDPSYLPKLGNKNPIGYPAKADRCLALSITRQV